MGRDTLPLRGVPLPFKTGGGVVGFAQRDGRGRRARACAPYRRRRGRLDRLKPVVPRGRRRGRLHRLKPVVPPGGGGGGAFTG